MSILGISELGKKRFDQGRIVKLCNISGSCQDLEKAPETNPVCLITAVENRAKGAGANFYLLVFYLFIF